jgi:hypothetical protein
MDALVSASVAAAVCAPSEPAKVRIESRDDRIRALGLLRQTGGYARYPQNVFGITNAQVGWLSENKIHLEIVLPATGQAA